jgi:hypothetical protein
MELMATEAKSASSTHDGGHLAESDTSDEDAEDDKLTSDEENLEEAASGTNNKKSRTGCLLLPRYIVLVLD